MRTLSRWLLAAGFCLALFGSKLWLIDTAGTDLPVVDQWDAECEVVLRPWLEGWMRAKEIIHPHNEHRPVATKLLALGLFAANGQWDARLEMVANAAIHVLSALVLLQLGRRWLARGWLAAYGVLLALLFVLPVAWENTLFGFQSQFYFLLLFSLGHIVLSVADDRFSGRWLLGQLCGAAVLATMAPGFLSSVAVLAVLGHRFVRERRMAAQPAVTASLAVVFAVAGWLLKFDVPAHAHLRAQGVGEFLLGLFRLLSWPGVAWFPWTLLLWAPVAAFIVRRTFRRETTANDAVLLGLIGWVILQAAATAYARGGTVGVLAPRYFDLLVVNVAVAFLALASETAGRARGVLVGAWSAVLLAGLAQQTAQAWRDSIPPLVEQHQRQEDHVREFLRTGDPASLLNAPANELAYPVAPVLAQRLSVRAIQDILPASVRRPVALGADEPHAVPAALPAGNWPVAVSTWTPAGPAPALDWRSARQPASSLPVLRFRIAGDLGRPGHALSLVVKSAAGEVAVEPDAAPGPRWKTVNVARPPGEWWLEVRDADPDGWFAFSGPFEVGRWSWLAQKLTRLHLAVILAGLALVATGALLARRLPAPPQPT